MTNNKTTTTAPTLSLEAAIMAAKKAIAVEEAALRAEARKEERLAREVEAVRLKAEALGLNLPEGLIAPSEARTKLAALEAVDPEARRTKVIRELTRLSQGKPWAWRVRRAVEEGRLPQFDQIPSFLARLEAEEAKAKAKK